MNETAIIEIDAILRLVDASRMTGNEIVKLDKAGHQPNEEEGYYLAAQQVLSWRTVFNPNAKAQLDALSELATLDGVILPEPEVTVPEVHVPIFALGL